jgi:hypothetical protein
MEILDVTLLSTIRSQFADFGEVAVEAVETAVKRFAGLNLYLKVSTYSEGGYDDESGKEYPSQWHSETVPYDVLNVVSRCLELSDMDSDGFREEFESWASATEHEFLESVIRCIGYDDENAQAEFLTAEQFQEQEHAKFVRRMNEQRARYEPIACQFAHKNGVTFGTPEFMTKLSDALSNAQEDERKRRYGMREDRLCASGGSVEAWYDMYNTRSKELIELDGLMDWIQQFQPLLYSVWQSSRLQTA